MKNFKSFLSMSPTDRKKLMDELFDVSIIMAVAESLKSDAKELGNSINGDNGTLFSLNQTLGNSQKELAQIQAKNSTPESLDKIEQNNKQIETLNSQMAQYNEAMKTVAEKQQENRNAIDAKNREITENSMVLRQIQEKINLFSQSKCPTCGTPFTGDIFKEARKKLDELKAARTEQATRLNNERAELMAKTSKIEEARKKVDNGIYQIRINVNNLLNENALINEKAKATAEYTAVENIINQTQAQIDDIKAGINEKTVKLTRLQQLQKVYSLDGVLRLMIENWVPALNEEIGEYLTLLNFPYMLKFDSKLDATVTDMGQNVPIETLSEGEKTRLNVVIVLSLVKIIKKRMPSLNVMSFDETISTLDTMTSELLLSMLYAYAEEQALNIIVVSHTDLSLELFDEIIEVEKQNGFSKFEIKNNVL
jgi:DNA repair exonuclease SbcCD ATPase subunit